MSMDFEGMKKHVFDMLKQKLPANLMYHGLHHTIDVLQAAESYIVKENVTSEYDQIMLKSGAILHDSGFVKGYKDHEENGVLIAQEVLPKFGYSNADIEIISGLIRATKVPQNPKTHLEEILCDCDLDYLGRTDFIEVSKTLFNEWQTMGIVNDEYKYDEMQIKFLSAHSYFTNYAKNERAKNKAQRLKELKEKY